MFPRYPLTISHVMKVIKVQATCSINQHRQETGQLWQPPFFDRIVRRVKEYHDYVEYIHLNPVRRGLVGRPEEWKWSSIHEYGGSFEPLLRIDRILLPADQSAFV
jgi:putative transposase